MAKPKIPDRRTETGSGGMVRQQFVARKLYLNRLGCIKPWTSARHYMIKRQSGEAGKVHSLGYVQAEQDPGLGLAALLGGLKFIR